MQSQRGYNCEKDTSIFLIESSVRQSRGGVARYVRQMVRGLHSRYGHHFVACSGLAGLPESVRRVRLPLRYPWRYTSRLLYEGTTLLERGLLCAVEKRLKPSVIFSPFYGPLASLTPQVFTVYDLILHLFPEYFPAKARRLELEHMRRCFLRAAAILCISNSTRTDLFRFHPDLDPKKVHVVPLGVSQLFYQPPIPTNSRPYFLFVGTRFGYKNFDRLLEAFSLSGLAHEFDLRVISPQTPGAEWSAAERDFILSKDLEKSVKLHVGASDQELGSAYAGAVAFICPSEYEGFGLPVLEAFAAGTIVACSRTSSLPEAGGAAAFYFDPLDVQNIATSLNEVVQLDAVQRAERVREGRRHAKNLSWDKCINTTCEILESVAHKNSATQNMS